MSKSMQRTTIFLQPELRKRVADTAKRLGRRQSDIVREAIERYADEAQSQLPASIGMIDDKTMSGANVEEYRTDWARHLERPGGDR